MNTSKYYIAPVIFAISASLLTFPAFSAVELSGDERADILTVSNICDHARTLEQIQDAIKMCESFKIKYPSSATISYFNEKLNYLGKELINAQKRLQYQHKREAEIASRSQAKAIKPAPSAPDVPKEIIDINSATEIQLQSLPQLGPRTADKIVAERNAKGPFSSFNDLGTRVRGIGPETISKWQSLAVCKIPPTPIAVVSPITSNSPIASPGASDRTFDRNNLSQALLGHWINQANKAIDFYFSNGKWITYVKNDQYYSSSDYEVTNVNKDKRSLSLHAIFDPVASVWTTEMDITFSEDYKTIDGTIEAGLNISKIKWIYVDNQAKPDLPITIEKMRDSDLSIEGVYADTFITFNQLQSILKAEPIVKISLSPYTAYEYKLNIWGALNVSSLYIFFISDDFPNGTLLECIYIFGNGDSNSINRLSSSLKNKLGQPAKTNESSMDWDGIDSIDYEYGNNYAYIRLTRSIPIFLGDNKYLSLRAYLSNYYIDMHKNDILKIEHSSNFNENTDLTQGSLLVPVTPRAFSEPSPLLPDSPSAIIGSTPPLTEVQTSEPIAQSTPGKQVGYTGFYLGMSKDKAISLLKQNGIKHIIDKVCYYGKGAFINNIFYDSRKPECLFTKVFIAEINTSHIEFNDDYGKVSLYFDDDGILMEITAEEEVSDPFKKKTLEWDTLVAALKDKYGNPSKDLSNGGPMTGIQFNIPETNTIIQLYRTILGVRTLKYVDDKRVFNHQLSQYTKQKEDHDKSIEHDATTIKTSF